MKIPKVNFYNVNSNKKITSKNTSCPINQNNSRIIKDLSNIRYVDLVSFGCTIKEHQSYGANVYKDNDGKKKVSFKIATFDDVEKVWVNIFKDGKNKEKIPINTYELENKGDGVFEREGISIQEIKNGDSYNFTIQRNGTQTTVKDPYSKRQKDFSGYSTIYDNAHYNWKNDKSWKVNPLRISRRANDKNNLCNFKKLRIYEIHIPTFTQKGDFESAKEKLRYVKDLGFNAVEIMPLENTYGFNWGYDGVDKFAPAEYIEEPDKVKELVDYGHQIGLNMIIDAVYNHVGTDGCELKDAGPFLTAQKHDFGHAFNFEGEEGQISKDYVVNAALNWLKNYHFDAIRLDMTSKMNSDFALSEITSEIHYHFPDAVIIAEDGRDTLDKVTKPLSKEINKEGKPINEHLKSMDYLKCCAKENNISVLEGLGCETRWAFPYHHTLHRLLTDYDNEDGKKSDDTYKDTYNIMQNFINVCKESENFVNYFSSHDEQGNYDGTRKIAKYMAQKLNKDEKRGFVYLNDDDYKRIQNFVNLKRNISYEKATNMALQQKMQLAAGKILEIYQTGGFKEYSYDHTYPSERVDYINNKLYDEVLNDIGIRRDFNITYEKIKDAFEKSAAQMRLAEVITFAKPGQKMIFQGDEELNSAPFRFARQFSPNNQKEDDEIISTEKGYKAGLDAFLASKLNSLDDKYSKDAKSLMDKYRLLTKDVCKLNEQNPALTTGTIVDDYIHINTEGKRIAGFQSYDDKTGNQIYTIVNFDDEEFSYDKNNPYKIILPKGKWVEQINSDDIKYGGNGKVNKVNDQKENYDDNIFESGGDNFCSINLAPYSAVVFKKID